MGLQPHCSKSVAYKRLTADSYCRWYTGDDSGLDSDSLTFAYELLHHAGYLRTLFYDREDAPGLAEVLNFWMQKKFLTFILYHKNGTPFGMCWMELLGTTMPCQRYIHFATFKTMDDSLWFESGKQLYRFVRDNLGIRQLIGLTPKCYRHALKRSEGFGFYRIATLTDAVWCLGKRRDAVLTINNLDDLGPFQEV